VAQGPGSLRAIEIMAVRGAVTRYGPTSEALSWASCRQLGCYPESGFWEVPSEGPGRSTTRKFELDEEITQPGIGAESYSHSNVGLIGR
jgi:hypothetical protein